MEKFKEAIVICLFLLTGLILCASVLGAVIYMYQYDDGYKFLWNSLTNDGEDESFAAYVTAIIMYPIEFLMYTSPGSIVIIKCADFFNKDKTIPAGLMNVVLSLIIGAFACGCGVMGIGILRFVVLTLSMLTMSLFEMVGFILMIPFEILEEVL